MANYGYFSACLSLLPGIRTDDLQSAYNQGGRDGGGGFGGRAGIAGGGGGDGELSGVEADLLMLQSVIPGIPGEDYPILSEVPELDFACDDKVRKIDIKKCDDWWVDKIAYQCKIIGWRWKVCRCDSSMSSVPYLYCGWTCQSEAETSQFPMSQWNLVQSAIFHLWLVV